MLARLARPAALLALSALLPLTACHTHRAPKPVIDDSPLRGSEAVDRDAYAKLGYRLDWSSFGSFARGAGLKGVYPLGDLLALQDGRGNLTVLREASGEKLWSAELGNPFDTYLGIERDGGSLIAATSSELRIYDIQTGEFRTRQPFQRIAASGPARVADVYVMGTGSGVAYGHLLRTAQTGWAFTLAGPSTTDPVLGAIDSVAFASDDGSLTVLDPGSGNLRGFGRMFGKPGSSIDAGSGHYFVPSSDQSLYAFRIDNAQLAWRFRTQTALTNPAVWMGDFVAIQVPGTGLVAINTATGTQRWIAPSVTGNAVVLRDGKLVTFD
nr:PQQ-like beta-propeller repeat protein [Phycisphaerales bacterium]